MAQQTTPATSGDANTAPMASSGQPQPVAQTTSSLAQFQPVHLDPPPDIERPKRNLVHRLRMGGSEYILSTPHRWGRRERCARHQYCRGARRMRDDKEKPYIERIRDASSAAESASGKSPYIVVGIMGNHHNIPRETLMGVTTPESLFRVVHRASLKIRPLHRRFLSFKQVAAFGMYMCISEKGFHVNVEMDHQTEQILSNMFEQYQSGEPDYGNRWLDWVQTQFNNDSTNPAEGRYALQLLLRWSPMKIAFWGIAAIIFSLVIGFWYQWRDYPWAQPSDHVAITQTAWTISSYILTTAGVAIAILGAVTQIGDV